MSTKIKIKVTKDIYQQAQHCGYIPGNVSKSCAIALAIRELLPRASIDLGTIHAFGYNTDAIPLPTIAQKMIRRFDTSYPDQRLLMEPMEFEIEISDCILEKAIPIASDLQKIFANSSTLELV